jgi:hypothetical protein
LIIARHAGACGDEGNEEGHDDSEGCIQKKTFKKFSK